MAAARLRDVITAGPGLATLSVNEVLQQTLAWLGKSVGFDDARALAYDPEAFIPVSFAARESLTWEHSLGACHNEQAEADIHKFRDLARSRQHVAAMTGDSAEARKSLRWQNLILPDGFRQELRAVAVDDHGHCWGAITAFRASARRFTDKDTSRVDRELTNVAARLARAMVARTEPTLSGPAASLWLSETGELLFATPVGREWLDRLRSPEMPRRADAVLTGIAVRVAASMRGLGPTDRPNPVSLRVRGETGQWIALYGEPIIGPDGRTRGISVALGPARPEAVLPLMVAGYGLTPRECEVVRGVLAGYSTKEMSARLRISTYTVQDHLKAIFTKVGVSSRGELAHHLALQFA